VGRCQLYSPPAQHAAMRTQPKDPCRELGWRRHPHPTAPSSHPEAGAGKAAPACQDAGGPRVRAASPSHPAPGSEPLPARRGQSLRSSAGTRRAAGAGPHPAQRARAVIHIPSPPAILRRHGSRCCRDDVGDACGLPRGSRQTTSPSPNSGRGSWGL